MIHLNSTKSSVFFIKTFSGLFILLIGVVFLFVLNSRHSKHCSNEDIESYYTPSIGTQNLHFGERSCKSPNLLLNALPSDVIVNEELGRRIFRMSKTGNVVWEHVEEESNIFDLEVRSDHVVFSTKRQSIMLDLDTGTEISRVKIGRKNDLRCYDDMVACAEDGIWIRSQGLKIPAAFPRHSVIKEGVIYIADTFNHTIVAYDLNNGRTLWNVTSYFPNSIEFLNNDELLITEEHANRIISLNIHSKKKRLIYGCNVDIFLNVNNNVKEIAALEKTGKLTLKNGRSVCAGHENLYSPNGATATRGGYLVSDTDNHRVLFIYKNKIMSQIVNLNNPISAYFL